MMPIRDVVIFPYMMTPFVVGRESSVRALEDAMAGDKKIFLAIDEWATSGTPPNLRLALSYAMVMQEMFRHTDFIKMSAFTFATSTLDYNGTDAIFNTTGLMFKLYREHYGTLPIEVTGDSPQPSPKWPVGEAAERSSDVADKVKGIPGSIGYVEYQYAVKANIPQAAVLNPAGRFVKASMETIAAACDAAEEPRWNNFSASLTNVPGAESYPITSFTWI